MNKSNINELSAQTEADSNSTAQNPSVSQPNANTNVVGSLFSQREMKFKYIFKTYDGRFIVEIFTLKELEYGGLQNFLSGLHDIIIVSKCQYTGLKDKNGKEIYEGDILLLPDTESETVDTGIGVPVKVAETSVSTIGYVVFKNGGFGVQINDGGENWLKGFTSFHATDYTNVWKDCDNSDLEKEIEVIGNIFETPELLETLW